MAYATVDDLADYVTTVPAGAAILLDRASRAIDQALLCAVYDPDDPEIQATLRAATCEQAACWAEDGTTGTGAASQYTSVSIGSVSLSRGAAPGGTSGNESLAPQAAMVLQQAGLTGHSPRSQ